MLADIHRAVTLLILICATHDALSCAFPSSSPGGQHCCFPDQFNGKLIYSFPGKQTNLQKKISAVDVELKFAIDFKNHRIFGEHVIQETNGQQRRFEFLADTNAAKSIVIKEKLMKECWKVSLRDTISDQCALSVKQYRGDMTIQRGGLDITGKLFAMIKLQKFEGSSNLNSLLLVASDTCLPIRDMSDHNTVLSSFLNMECGLGLFENTNVEEKCDEYLDGKDDESTDNGQITASQRLEMYTYLIYLFFPPAPPAPCCGPDQWQASAVKYIAYTSDGQVGNSVVIMPQISVDHAAGKISAQAVLYFEGQVASNVSYVVEYGSNSFIVYQIDWRVAGGACTVLEVLNSQRVMHSKCMSPTAQYEKTIRMGGGLFDSIRLNVFSVRSENTSLSYTAQLYVTPVDCVTTLTAYTWNSATEKVRGTLILSDVRTHIKDPNHAFTVPSACDNEEPTSTTSEQLNENAQSLIAFIGGA